MTAPITDVVPAQPDPSRLYRLLPDTVTVIGRDTEDGPEHELWDERVFLENNEEQILSFMAIGVQTPLLARRGLGGRTEIVEGRRRTIESREANRRLLALGETPVVLLVRFGSARISPELQLILSVELNERRVFDPPSVKARKAQRMLARKIPPTTVARTFGVTQKTIENWVLSLNAPADVIAAADLGMIPQSAVVELARAPEPVKALEEILLEAKPGRARAAAVAKAQRTGGESSKMPRGAVRRVLAAKTAFEPEFIRGVRFAKGELGVREVEKILKMAEKS